MKPPRPSWNDLHDALAGRRAIGRRTTFWLRDDDAVAPKAALERLLRLCGRYSVPLALAVIPAHVDIALAARLAGEPLASVVVHGWAHANHAPAGEKKQELGLHRPQAEVEAELIEALARLKALFGEKLVPALVPPWNRIDPALIPRLAGLGYAGLSTFGPAKPAPLRIVNASLDIIDWHGTRGCRDHGELIAEILARLADGRPIGVLTHHLVHDEACWHFLDALFALCTAAAGCDWMSVEGLLAQRPADT